MTRALTAAALFLLTSAACGGRVTQSDCETTATCVAPASTSPGGGQGGGSAVGGGDAPEVPPAPSMAPIEGALVSGLTSPALLAVDDANVYFSTQGAVMACPKSGCAGGAAVLAKTQGVGGIVSNGSEVFWTDGAGSVMACAATGCNGQPRVVASVPSPMAIAIADKTLYWTTLSGQIQRCGRSCTTPETLATDTGNGLLLGIAVSGTNVYWTRSGDYDGSGWTGAVRTCSAAQGACVPQTLADRQNNTRAVAVDGDELAWTADGETTVRRCTLPSCSDVTAMTRGGQEGIAMSGDRVYWSYASGGWIESATYGGGAASDFVTGQPATFLAADATNLFWIDTDIPDSRGGTPGTGRIMSARLAPP